MAIKKINLDAMTVMQNRIKVDNTLINTINTTNSVTKAKAKEIIATALPIVTDLIQKTIECDKVTYRDILDENNNVIGKQTFHVTSVPYREYDKVEISETEADRLLTIANDEKTATVKALNAKIAVAQAVKDAMVNPVEDTDE